MYISSLFQSVKWKKFEKKIEVSLVDLIRELVAVILQNNKEESSWSRNPAEFEIIPNVA